jgi:hypothetical protein
MTKTVYYTYLGTNGVIESPVHLEDVFYTRKLRLTADKGKQLTKDGKNFFSSVMIPESDLAEWKEV